MMSDTETIEEEAVANRHIDENPHEACGHGFILDIEKLTFPGMLGIAALRASYNASAFHDTLYASFGIVFPDSIRLAVRKRRAEYLAGRYLGRILLGERGMPTEIASGNHRQPLWPSGWVGSITHTDDVAVCCIASQANVGILGVDVEHWFDVDTAASIGATIVLRDEQSLLDGPWSYPHALTLAFSAKESLFKAVYPKVGHYFDFHCAKLIDVDYAAGTFSLLITNTLSAAIAAGSVYRGYFENWGSRVFTLITEDWRA